MSIDALTSRFEDAGLKRATRSRLAWWLEEQGVSATDAPKFLQRVLESGLWEPFEGDRLPEQTDHETAGYRDAARAIRTITLRPPKRSLLLTFGFLAILPLWISYAVRDGLDDWFAWLQACFALPPSLFGAVQLFRFVRPARIEVESGKATSTRGDTVRGDEVRFVDVARHSDATVRSALPKRGQHIGFLLGHYQDNVWVVYGQRIDGSVVILGDHLHEQTARAAALRLERGLDLDERAQIHSRVEVDANEEATVTTVEEVKNASRTEPTHL